MCSRPTPLRSLYVLERGSSSSNLKLEALSPTASLNALLTFSSVTEAVASLGGNPRRLSALARAVRQTEIKRLGYPSGFDRLEEVCSVIDRDFASAAGR